MRRLDELKNKKFGTKTVVGYSHTKNSRAYWKFVCDCGGVGVSLTQSVKRGGRCEKCAYKGARPNRRKRPFESAYNNFVKRARYPVTITYEQFYELAKIKECHYCGAPVVWQEWRNKLVKGGAGSNLDRKDNMKPYTIDNVVVCCGRCNYAKGSHFTYNEWVEIGRVIRSFPKRNNYLVTPQSGRALANLEKELEKEKHSTS